MRHTAACRQQALRQTAPRLRPCWTVCSAGHTWMVRLAGTDGGTGHQGGWVGHLSGHTHHSLSSSSSCPCTSVYKAGRLTPTLAHLPPPSLFPAAAARRAASEEPSIVAINERAHQRQLAAALLERWTADLDAARPSVLTPTLFASLLRAYSQSGQVHTVLLLMWQAFGCQLSPDTVAALGISSSSCTSSEAAAGPAAAAATAAGGGGAVDALDAALEEDSSRQAAAQSSSSSSSGREGLVGSQAKALQDSGSGEGSSQSSRSRGDSKMSSSGSSGGDMGGNDTEARMLSPLRQSTVDNAQLAPSLSIFNAAIGACTRVGHAHMRDAVALLRSMLVRLRSRVGSQGSTCVHMGWDV